MPAGFDAVFAALKPILAKYAKRLVVKTDKPGDYLLVTKSPSPFPQHKGQPMFFAQIRTGKAYVSLHLLPLYMNKALNGTISADLAKRKQGMACFNFRTVPDAALVRELKELTATCLEEWAKRKYL